MGTARPGTRPSSRSRGARSRRRVTGRVWALSRCRVHSSISGADPAPGMPQSQPRGPRRPPWPVRMGLRARPTGHPSRTRAREISDTPRYVPMRAPRERVRHQEEAAGSRDRRSPARRRPRHGTTLSARRRRRGAVSGGSHHGDDLRDGWRVGPVADALVGRRSTGVESRHRGRRTTASSSDSVVPPSWGSRATRRPALVPRRPAHGNEPGHRMVRPITTECSTRDVAGVGS